MTSSPLYIPERFSVKDEDAWLTHLDVHGYCVVKDALSPHERDETDRLLAELCCPGERARGCDAIALPDAAHSAFAWYLRGLPTVVQALEAYWGTGDLVVSFGPCAAAAEVLRDGLRLHTDQNWSPTRLPGCSADRMVQAHSLGFLCAAASMPTPASRTRTDCPPAVPTAAAMQGCVVLRDIGDDAAGGVVVWPGSHHHHASGYGIGTPPVVRGMDCDPPAAIPPDQLPGAPVHLACARGDLVLWDSRTLHSLTACPRDSAAEPEGAAASGGERPVVASFAMVPSVWLSVDDVADRRAMLRAGLAGGPWCVAPHTGAWPPVPAQTALPAVLLQCPTRRRLASMNHSDSTPTP
eukprot:TRINITY_DN56754_c0_g1_i1.p1 TRINITY_DN56754_c0_g1~~TRINITY_DN56754_c0_g1_i1.p1  ORF type:complete len:352 (+),score=34.13 TRINITY_DN56754_c0_g1_i1:135-1190(+)